MRHGLAREELAARTLGRQFPRIGARDESAVTDLLARLGPIQTQVPRAVFLTASSRLPGIAHATLVEAFERGAVVKGTTLRGTVHTTTARQHAWSAAVSGVRLDASLRTALRLDRVDAAAVRAETERLASGGWIDRDSLVDRVAAWLSDHESEGSGLVVDSHGRNVVWGVPTLVRRPADRRWHTRTDTLHRRAREVYADAVDGADDAPEAARAALVRVHLGSYGPATRRDVAWWLGDTLGAVDRAITALGDEVVVLADGKDPVIDLADAPADERDDVGLRLLPEFDGLMLGYAPATRDRFVDAAHLPRIFNRVNGACWPVVLDGGRITAVWRPVGSGRSVAVDVRTLPGERTPDEGSVVAGAAAVGTVLGVEIADVRVGPLSD
ncbi:winged helix DNA-binding protein [Mumia flava]|uniref:Winged helix DNA-binding protein n=1 Tax=Mumia flava TaxID=1348852 RepID=A0A0B2BPE4_9ACTN|nr:crosslink repair DNA glycosylase YcaQ family protein [Mumia flava]PJJ53640.1 winged helix DNA-binding protein [Mumia flava]